MTSPNPAREEAVAPDVLAKQVADAASDMCEIARIVGEWRHGPKQSLTALREIRECLAAKPPASWVDAVAVKARLNEKALEAACEAVLAVPDHPGDKQKIRDAIATYIKVDLKERGR